MKKIFQEHHIDDIHYLMSHQLFKQRNIYLRSFIFHLYKTQIQVCWEMSHLVFNQLLVYQELLLILLFLLVLRFVKGVNQKLQSSYQSVFHLQFHGLQIQNFIFHLIIPYNRLIFKKHLNLNLHFQVQVQLVLFP